MRYSICVCFIIFILNSLYSFCNACLSSSNYCDVENWGPWGKCSATCGGGKQVREKYICCQYNSLMDCLQGCGIPLSLWKTNATEERACGKCKHHGVFNTTLNRCICKSGYGGKCCNDIDNCADEPFEYGVCTDKVNDFSCDCMAFFKGKMCNKMEAWAIALLSLAALAFLLTCCCCFWCIMGTCNRDDEKRKVRPLKEKSRQNPKKDLLVTIGYKGPSSSTHNKRTM